MIAISSLFIHKLFILYIHWSVQGQKNSILYSSLGIKQAASENRNMISIYLKKEYVSQKVYLSIIETESVYEAKQHKSKLFLGPSE